jgi:hypothetical protein
VPGARAVRLALSSSTDKTAHDRDYVVIFTEGPFVYTLFTDSPNAGPAGHFRERDVLTAARSLSERVHRHTYT